MMDLVVNGSRPQSLDVVTVPSGAKPRVGEGSGDCDELPGTATIQAPEARQHPAKTFRHRFYIPSMQIQEYFRNSPIFLSRFPTD